MSLLRRVRIAERAHKHSDDRYRITEHGDRSVDECGQVLDHVDGPLVPAADLLDTEVSDGRQKGDIKHTCTISSTSGSHPTYSLRTSS